MQRGTELEPLARDEYVFVTGTHVEQVAFIDHPTLDYAGVSPDGLIGSDGVLEIKCYASEAKHMNALENMNHDLEYKWQNAMLLEVTGREWVDFCAYEPTFPEDLKLARKRVTRAMLATEIAALRAELPRGEQDVKQAILSLNHMQRKVREAA